MRDCEDIDQLVDHGVDDREWKSPENEVTDIAIDGSSELRIFEQQLDNSFDFFAEFQASPKNSRNARLWAAITSNVVSGGPGRAVRVRA